MFGGYRYERSGAGGGSSGAGFGSRDFAQAKRHFQPGFPSHQATHHYAIEQLWEVLSSTGQLRDRSPSDRRSDDLPKNTSSPTGRRRATTTATLLYPKKPILFLNKLTLEKFDRLSTEFLPLEFSTLERVAGAVDLIVTKAQTESHFVSSMLHHYVSNSRTRRMRRWAKTRGRFKSSDDCCWKDARRNLNATIPRPSPSWNRWMKI